MDGISAARIEKIEAESQLPTPYDVVQISNELDEISLAVDALNLWVERTAGENRLDLALLHAEKEKRR